MRADRKASINELLTLNSASVETPAGASFAKWLDIDVDVIARLNEG